jgi:glycine C-acetyltransferase
MGDKLDFMRQELEAAKAEKRYINIRTMDSPADGWMVVDGEKVLNFCTNNYLGLANHPKVKEAAKKAVDEWGVGPGAVRTIAGTQRLHVECERRLAEFKRVEAALLVQSGFAPTRPPSRRWWAGTERLASRMSSSPTGSTTPASLTARG